MPNYGEKGKRLDVCAEIQHWRNRQVKNNYIDEDLDREFYAKGFEAVGERLGSLRYDLEAMEREARAYCELLGISWLDFGGEASAEKKGKQEREQEQTEGTESGENPVKAAKGGKKKDKSGKCKFCGFHGEFAGRQWANAVQTVCSELICCAQAKPEDQIFERFADVLRDCDEGDHYTGTQVVPQKKKRGQ
jgi:hypothetical protein